MTKSKYLYQIANYFILATTKASIEDLWPVIDFFTQVAEQFPKYDRRILSINTADKKSADKLFYFTVALEKVGLTTHGVLVYERPTPDLNESHHALDVACNGEYKEQPILLMSEVPLKDYMAPIMKKICFTGVRGNNEMIAELQVILSKNPKVIIYDAHNQKFIH